ncbi:MAG: 3-dehydroquinate synthase [bacterium]
MAKIKVDLKERSYEIIVGNNILTDLGELIERNKWGREIFIITDPVVNGLYGEGLTGALKNFTVRTLIVPCGERFKNLRAMTKLYNGLVNLSAHRDALVIALGGGVIGDIAGFLAATYMRGLSFIQVPTTLLSQVDAAIGGKTGVNHPKGKNLIGAFYQPKLVLIDVQTLTTLPARELRTGLAEVVKYGVMQDYDFFKFLEENAHHLNTKAFGKPDTKRAALKVWEIIVTESAKIKAKVVAKDEKEADLRMVLNLGHTVGHALETSTDYKVFNHGEAVAIGLVAAAKISELLGLLETKSVARIEDLLKKLGLPTSVKSLSIRKILRILKIDKKVKGDRVNFVLPEKIGKVIIKDDVPIDIIKKALKGIGCK